MLSLLEATNSVRVPLPDPDCLSLPMTLDSGQAFRWYPSSSLTGGDRWYPPGGPAGESYTGVVGRSALRVSLNHGHLDLRLLAGADPGINGLSRWAWDYFDLSTDYGALMESLARDDRILSEATAFARGLRVLKQDPWETLICFIISANNNIPRIKAIVKALCENYGEELEPIESRSTSESTSGRVGSAPRWYSFPSPESLARANEEELRSKTRMGFRAPYVIGAARAVCWGELPLWSLSQLPTEEARAELMKLKGVGRKIADCVLLFSMQKYDAFPIDVWAKRALENLYFNGETRPLRELQDFAARKFGDLRGYAQNYLFYFVRETSRRPKTG